MIKIDKNELIKKFNERLNLIELSKYFNCSTHTISRNLKKAGLSLIERTKLCNVKYDVLYNMVVVENMRINEVAEIFNVSIDTVKRKIKELGIPTLQKRHQGITKEKLEDLYFNKKMTQNEIAKHLKCGRSFVVKKFKEYGIKKEHVMDKINKGEIKRMYLEGIPPVLISSSLKVPLNIVSKFIYKSKYINDRSEESRLKAKELAYNVSLSHSRSKVEAELEKLFPTEFTNLSSIIGLELDLWYPEHKLAIEYNGDYWHSTKHGRNANLHLNKLSICRNKGIHLINIFERDWLNEKTREKLIILIQRLLYPQNFKIPNGCIKKVPNSIRQSFEKTYNIAGTEKATHCMGIFNEDKLVSTLSYNISEDKCHIIRYTTQKDYLEDYSILFNCIKSKYKIPILIGYDNRYYDTSFIDTSKFVLYEKIEPKLFYVFKTKAYREEDVPLNILENKNCNKVYDCGFTKWIWN